MVVVDVQNDVVAAAYDRDAVVARIADLVERARAGGGAGTEQRVTASPPHRRES